MYHVIVIEDEELLRKGLILTTDWASLSLRVIGEADNGIDGELLARKLRPDIIIADVAMPGIDGLEMIRRLHEDLPLTEFLIISGHAEFSFAQKALTFGVRGYILKPIDSTILITHLQKAVSAIERHKGEQAKEKRAEQIMNGMKKFPSLAIGSNTDYRDKYIQEAISVIEKHYKEHLTANDIATSMQVSERTLTNLFKERWGYTLLEYLTLYRMRKAVGFLQEKELSVYEVASRVGYKDYRYFSKIFKATFSMTPTEYKKGGKNDLPPISV